MVPSEADQTAALGIKTSRNKHIKKFSHAILVVIFCLTEIE